MNAARTTRETEQPDEVLEILIRRRDKYLAQAKGLEAVIAAIKALNESSASSIPSLIAVEKDQYQGKSRPYAFEDYMRQRKGQRISLNKIVSDLLLAGVDPGKPRSADQTPADTMEQNLKIALSQQDRVKPLYSYFPGPGRLTNIDPRDITVWLSVEAENSGQRKPRKP